MPGTTITFEQAEEYLYHLTPGKVELGLERLRRVLKVLGDPHLELPCILVAGTNGKGTVVTALASVLAERYRVGAFVKPHLVSLVERVQVDRRPISRHLFAELTDRVRRAVAEAGVHLTYFEQTFLIALLGFLTEEVELAVFEVGLGGRLDATNAMEPVVSVITTVDLDHTHLLGETVEEIAREKAGIMRPNAPVVVGRLPDAALAVVRQQAHRLGCEVHQVGHELDLIGYDPDRMVVRFFLAEDQGEVDPLTTPMCALYQLEDLAVVLRTLKVMRQVGIPTTRKDVVRGMRRAFIAGRFDLRFVGGQPVLFDAAHNPSGARALAESLIWFCRENRWPSPEGRLELLFGCQATKDPRAMLAELAGLVRRVYPIEIQVLSPAPKEEIAQAARELGLEVEVTGGWQEALERALMSSEGELPVVVCGSIYYLGQIYRRLGLDPFPMDGA